MSQGSLLSPRVLFPFALVTLIWGGTWIVIKDQLGSVPPAWSIAYRFAIAAAAMFLYAALTRRPLRIDRRGHLLAIGFGIPQFVLNFNFVYLAERFVTSGLVAVTFALLLVPNTAFGWLFLKHRITRGFLLGSGIAVVGVTLLFVQEMRATTLAPGAVLVGVGLTLLGVLSASVSNVMQATDGLRARPVATMIAWGMTYGALANAAIAFTLYGGPVAEARLGYWVGLLYLSLAASALAFTLYFGVIRAVGPGRAAYSSLLVPIIAMAISTALEDYRWSTLAVAGGALALSGMALALRSKPA